MTLHSRFIQWHSIPMCSFSSANSMHAFTSFWRKFWNPIMSVWNCCQCEFSLCLGIICEDCQLCSAMQSILWWRARAELQKLFNVEFKTYHLVQPTKCLPVQRMPINSEWTWHTTDIHDMFVLHIWRSQPTWNIQLTIITGFDWKKWS